MIIQPFDVQRVVVTAYGARVDVDNARWTAASETVSQLVAGDALRALAREVIAVAGGCVGLGIRLAVRVRRQDSAVIRRGSVGGIQLGARDSAPYASHSCRLSARGAPGRGSATERRVVTRHAA